MSKRLTWENGEVRDANDTGDDEAQNDDDVEDDEI